VGGTLAASIAIAVFGAPSPPRAKNAAKTAFKSILEFIFSPIYDITKKTTFKCLTLKSWKNRGILGF